MVNAQKGFMHDPGKEIGYVVSGGLKENLTIRLTVPGFQVQEGSFIVIKSGIWQFYGIATDLQLGAVDPRFSDQQITRDIPQGLAEILRQQTLFTNLVVLPALMYEVGPDPGSPAYRLWLENTDNQQKKPAPIPAKTIPPHHASAFFASAGDIAEIFGSASERKNFIIGYTREQNHPVCINLQKFIQRSSGIFGATGTGKSFLTRIILAGLIEYDQASVLVYDMHNEYGLDDTASDTGSKVTGLRSAFGRAKVQIAGLGSDASIRGSSPDFNVVLSYADIMPEDIEMLARELNLTETTAATLDALEHDFGKGRWFGAFMAMHPEKTTTDEDGSKAPAPDSVAFWAQKANIHPLAAKALHSKLQRLYKKPYIVEKPPVDSIQAITEGLKKGKHVVLSFGKYESDLDYLLISNLLTRRIREEWEKMTNAFRNGQQTEPRPLVITIEEAHKLLNRNMARQTTFSTIAREMRKYYVTLLVIDQRPSQIYDEVMSQLGTRICGWLGDDDDVHAVLSGLSGREALRGMLARLQPKEEVLLLGWGVPMPILVRSRRYDQDFFKTLRSGGKATSNQQDMVNKLYPD